MTPKEKKIIRQPTESFLDCFGIYGGEGPQCSVE